MANKLLIRAFDVGLGDCIYCRIPAARSVDGHSEDFHMLIDCGTWSGISHIKTALDHLFEILPDADNGRKRLDLVVATHEHKDHITGFDPALFARFRIGAIWMNTAMDPKHPQAKKTQALHSFAAQAMRSVAGLNLALSPELEQLVDLYSISNDGAVTALREGLPRANGIKARYVHAGMSNADLGLALTGATIRVLGPEKDIDHFYLGKEADANLKAVADVTTAAGGKARGKAAGAAQPPVPKNISTADFRTLRSRMLSSAFAFAELSGKVTNNTSVVLLIEWKKKRLLFVGDAEWEEKFSKTKANGAWNVMWHQRKSQLNRPVDFLKVGHHGSVNATPWNDREDGEKTEPAKILDAILPLPAAGQGPRAAAVVSTERGRYETIPRAALLAELGKRVASTKMYQAAFARKNVAMTSIEKFATFEKTWIGKAQPYRTDFEHLLGGPGFIDIEIEA